jgi:hypothetical protein
VVWGDGMKKQQALGIVCHCAAEYKAKLEGKNFLFIFGDAENCSYFEAVFPKQNFQHLTGVHSPNLSTLEFYQACLDHRLSMEQFRFSDNGTTPLKLEVLPRLMDIYKTAKMVGDYDNSRACLYTEKIAGGVVANMGFVRDRNYPDSNFFVPNTIIKDDIRNLAVKPVQRVLSTLSKDMAASKYTLFTYLAKGISPNSPAMQEILREKAVAQNTSGFF